MDAAGVNAWFTGFHWFVYLGVIITGTIIWQLFIWSKVSDTCYLILVREESGDGRPQLVKRPSSGNCIEISSRDKKSTDTWTIDDKCFIDVPYPGLGFVPKFLQKKIPMAVLDRNDFEPLSKRKEDGLVATPSLLGNLINEKITEAVVTVNQQIMDAIKGMSKTIEPKYFYILAVAIVAAVVYMAFTITSTLSEMNETLNIIRQGLGL